MVSPDKIAVCQSCGNEWEVRTAGTEKKRKCPLCGKYKVKMKSEVKDDGGKPNPGDPNPGAASPGSVGDHAPAPGNDVGRVPPGETRGENVEKNRRREENSTTSPDHSPHFPENSPPILLKSPEEKSGEKGEENSGGGIITYAALLLLAVGAGWFLIGVRRRRRADAVDSEYDEVEQYNQRIPAFPGF